MTSLLSRIGIGRQRVQIDPLDRALLGFSKHDTWSMRDAFEGTQIFGATGSGKTSGSGRAIAKSFLAAGFGGLVLTAKPDERALWEQYCHETGRSDSLLIVEPGGDYGFNFLDYQRKVREGDIDAVGSLFVEVLRIADRANGAGESSNGAFWERSVKQLIRNAVPLLAAAEGMVTLDGLYKLLISAPKSQETLEDPAWRERSFFFDCMSRAHANRPNLSSADQTALAKAGRYFLEVRLQERDETAADVQMTFTTMADAFLSGPMNELFCTDTTIVPELSHVGRVILIDLPVNTYGETGQVAQFIFKLLWQKSTRDRNIQGPGQVPVFLWADEAQHFVTPEDAKFQSVARSFQAATVYLTQSISSYYAVMGGKDPRAATDMLLGNLQTKVFHANGDPVTNEWAGGLFGKQWRTHVSSTNSTERDQHGFERPKNSTSTSRSLDPLVLARQFHNLRTGGPANGYCVEGIVFKSGRAWKVSRANHLTVGFNQNF